MLAAYVIVTVATMVANAWAAVADLARARFILANMREVGVPESWLAPLGILKGTGAAGLLVGLLGLRPVGIAAAIGLVLFFTGPRHPRPPQHRPGAYFALAIASAALAVAAR
jgi:hypothetical protein